MLKKIVISIVFMIVLSCVVKAEDAPWVKKSNENAQLLLQVFAKYNPEFAGQIGVEGIDEKIIDLNPGFIDRSKKDTNDALAALKSKLQTETDPSVKQDLEILIKFGDDTNKGNDLNEQYTVPYFSLSQVVFSGIRNLLDDQVAESRRPAALVRLKRYAGLESGFTPIATLAEARIREEIKPGRLYPSKAEVDKDLVNNAFFVDGIEKLFQKYKVAGYEEPYAKLKEQLAGYEAFVRKDILPNARQDFRLPLPLYEFSLEQSGISIPAEQLRTQAHAAFDEIQKQMQDLAPKIAKQQGMKVTDYRDVIRELKKKQLVGDAILAHYQHRIKQIEEIIRQHKIVTLPDRPMAVRIASEAEAASTPAPNMRPPRLLGNTGEHGEFVLPLNIPAAAGSKEATMKFDDFTHESMSWTLTAHEGRPGHELQFDSIIEKGVSIPRATFAFNSVNVEGWGLYSEYLMQQYEPLDGQLCTYQNRLLRAARAFLDPELQLGKIQPDDAKKILMNDVVLSEAMATQEVERYTFRSPGQAPSYFYGYTKLMELRKEIEGALGPKFDQLKFHDFILSQGLVPPELLKAAVEGEFLKGAKAATK